MEKGKTNNPGGRPKGSKNKYTYKTKELVSKFVDENFENIMDDLKKMKRTDRVQAFLTLMKFVVPVARDKEAEENTTNTINNLISRLFPAQNND